MSTLLHIVTYIHIDSRVVGWTIQHALPPRMHTCESYHDQQLYAFNNSDLRFMVQIHIDKNCNFNNNNQGEDFDFRFLKDIHWKEDPNCLCCCKGREMSFGFQNVAKEENADVVKSRNFTLDEAGRQWVTVKHPGVTHHSEKKLRAIWADARLVADHG